MTDIRVKIDEIRESGLKFHFKAPPHRLALKAREKHFQSPFIIEFTIDKLKKEFFITGFFKTQVTYQCGRCLKEFLSPLNEEFQFVFSRKIEDLENPEWYNREDQSIDVGEEIRECSLLVLKKKPLCAEDCKGLCPSCGTDLNVSSCRCIAPGADPRMQNLARFKKEES